MLQKYLRQDISVNVTKIFQARYTYKCSANVRVVK